MTKKYTMRDFTVNSYAYPIITAEGRISTYTGEYEINYSSVLSRLIQEAGRFCESFASDLFIDWEAVLRVTSENAGEAFCESFLFGFRQSGVDHAEFVFSRMESGGSYYYRSLWRLDVSADGREIKMELGRVF